MKHRTLTARLAAVAFAGVLFAACDVHAPSPTGTAVTTSPTLATITVTPNATLAINGTQQFSAVGKDAAGTVVSISPTWSVVAGGGAINNAGMFTAGVVAGVFTATVKAASNAIAGTASVTVTVGPLATITVSPVPVNLPINSTQQYTAVGKDAGGNVVVISPTWSVVAGGGTINSAALFTAGTVPGTFLNTVRATSGSISGNATVNVTSGLLATITVSPGPMSLLVNGTQQYTAVGRDAGGNIITITPTWSVVAGGGTINSAALFTAGGALGTFSNTIKATSGSISGTSSVTVMIGGLATITVTPSSDTMLINETQQFTAVGKDAGGNVVAISPSWMVVTGGGNISGNGLFTAGTLPGLYHNTIQATSGSISGHATVKVKKGPLATITVTPNPVTLSINGTQQFTAVGTDAGGNVVAISPAWWVVASGGNINSTGLFTAGVVAGTFTNTVEASSGGISGFATVVVTAPAPPPPNALLGSASLFGVLAGTTTTCVTRGLVSADLGVWPGSADTGFPPCVLTGTKHLADGVAQAAQGDLTAAYNQLAGMACLPANALTGQDLGGMTLAPGVYCFTSSAFLTGTLTLAGPASGTWVFQIASTLITGTNSAVVLIGGASAQNVYWQVGSSATVEVGTAMQGNILALTSISIKDNATLLGRALARNGAVTLDSDNIITLP